MRRKINVRLLSVVISGLSLVMWACIRLVITGLTSVRSIDEFSALGPDQIAEAVEFGLLFVSGTTFTLFAPTAVLTLDNGEYRFARFMAPVPWVSATAIGMSLLAMPELHPFG
ncbi:MAG: hypothetical protein HGA31_05565 [Candidatus Moranbacteria bacterium]|nr:hypothetical protein [Candidatus Moranbacteria bacterium]